MNKNWKRKCFRWEMILSFRRLSHPFPCRRSWRTPSRRRLGSTGPCRQWHEVKFPSPPDNIKIEGGNNNSSGELLIFIILCGTFYRKELQIIMNWDESIEGLFDHCSGYETACEEGPGVFAHILTFLSLLLIVITLPVSLVWVVKVVQVTSSLTSCGGVQTNAPYLEFLCHLRSTREPWSSDWGDW